MFTELRIRILYVWKTIWSPTVADDMVLVSLSKQGMDEMLDICWKYSQKWRYFYNAAKCKVVVFNDRPSKTLVMYLKLDQNQLM